VQIIGKNYFYLEYEWGSKGFVQSLNFSFTARYESLTFHGCRQRNAARTFQTMQQLVRLIRSGPGLWGGHL